MSRYVLDTDIISLFQGGDSVVVARCTATTPSELSITVITVEEVLSAWYTLLRRAKTRSRVALAYHRLAESTKLLGRLTILPYTEAAIDRFESLKAMKLGVRAPDLRIAAIALEFGGVLVTRNVRDFQQVPGLQLEDWTNP